MLLLSEKNIFIESRPCLNAVPDDSMVPGAGIIINLVLIRRSQCSKELIIWTSFFKGGHIGTLVDFSVLVGNCICCSFILHALIPFVFSFTLYL